MEKLPENWLMVLFHMLQFILFKWKIQNKEADINIKQYK